MTVELDGEIDRWWAYRWTYGTFLGPFAKWTRRNVLPRLIIAMADGHDDVISVHIVHDGADEEACAHAYMNDGPVWSIPLVDIETQTWCRACGTHSGGGIECCEVHCDECDAYLGTIAAGDALPTCDCTERR